MVKWSIQLYSIDHILLSCRFYVQAHRVKLIAHSSDILLAWWNWIRLQSWERESERTLDSEPAMTCACDQIFLLWLLSDYAGLRIRGFFLLAIFEFKIEEVRKKKKMSIPSKGVACPHDMYGYGPQPRHLDSKPHRGKNFPKLECTLASQSSS